MFQDKLNAHAALIADFIEDTLLIGVRMKFHSGQLVSEHGCNNRDGLFATQHARIR